MAAPLTSGLSDYDICSDDWADLHLETTSLLQQLQLEQQPWCSYNACNIKIIGFPTTEQPVSLAPHVTKLFSPSYQCKQTICILSRRGLYDAACLVKKLQLLRNATGSYTYLSAFVLCYHLYFTYCIDMYMYKMTYCELCRAAYGHTVDTFKCSTNVVLDSLVTIFIGWPSHRPMLHRILEHQRAVL